MIRIKKYYPWPFVAIGVVGLLVAFLLVRRLPGAGFLYAFAIAGSCVLLFYGLLNLLMIHLSDSVVRTIVNVMRHAIRIGAALLLVGFVVAEILIVGGGESDAGPGADYVIVLGAALHGETPSKILDGRLEAALDYLERNPDTKAVLSGGQGSGEDISEAEAMRRYLEAGGISSERLLLEDRSTNTAENIRFSKELIESGARVVLVSNEFHLFRSRRIARLNGLNAEAIAAPTPYWYLKVGYYVREYFSVVGMYLGRV